jgi:hypothetical protein
MGWTVRGSYPDMDKTFCSSLKHPHWLWGPPCILFSGYQGCAVGACCRGMQMITCHRLVLMLELYSYFSCMPLWHGEGKLCPLPLPLFSSYFNNRLIISPVLSPLYSLLFSQSALQQYPGFQYWYSRQLCHLPHLLLIVGSEVVP